MQRIALLLLFSFTIICSAIGQQFWTDLDNDNLTAEHLNHFRAFTLDSEMMLDQLKSAPQEYSDEPSLVIDFPMPDGSILSFDVAESPIMQPGLAAKFPTFKAWAGQGIEDRSATIRLDWTSKGLHAYIIAIKGSTLIEPINAAQDIYAVYNKEDLRVPDNFQHFCNHTRDHVSDQNDEMQQQANYRSVSIGDELRTFRFAVASAAEYTNYHGGTTEGAIGAIMTAVNRINSIFEKELSCRFILIDDNDELVYFNANTDPYTNGDSGDMLGENIDNIPDVVGNNAFDVGHVFATAGGGIAWLGDVCDPQIKAGGVTGVAPPAGDFFNVQYCCHELGHQFGGNHTWSNCGDELNGSQLSWETAFEPGSGSTIMSYAGLCGFANNVIQSSKDYYHGASLQEMTVVTNFVDDGCSEVTATGNNVPTVNAGESGFYIPISTPFELTAEASDPDEDDELSYCWEQYDNGQISELGSPMGGAPSFRSWPPKDTPTRVFPQISDIILGVNSSKEVLPTYSRELSFNCTVRDNRSGGGGIAQDLIVFNATSIAGPFVVTKPQQNWEYEIGSQMHITWDVANTDQPPVSCAFVDIYLSLDNGQTYPITLNTSIPNTGEATVTVPDNEDAGARVKVKGHGNIFFNISDKFRIIQPSVANQNIGDANDVTVFPNPAQEELFIELNESSNEVLQLSLYNIQGQLIQEQRSFSENGLMKMSLNGVIDGVYLLKIKASNKVYTKKIRVQS